jgi:hypothetical protein
MEEALGLWDVHPWMNWVVLGHPFIDSKYVTLGHPLMDEIGCSWASIQG